MKWYIHFFTNVFLFYGFVLLHCALGCFFIAFTGNYFEEWNEITPQNHIRKFEEQATWRWVPCWRSFLTSIGSSWLVWTLACGCQKWLPARHLSSSCLFFKLSDVSLGSNFVPFFKKVACKVASWLNKFDILALKCVIYQGIEKNLLKQEKVEKWNKRQTSDWLLGYVSPEKMK